MVSPDFEVVGGKEDLDGRCEKGVRDAVVGAVIGDVDTA